jgi:hypothetical protein
MLIYSKDKKPSHPDKGYPCMFWTTWVDCEHSLDIWCWLSLKRKVSWACCCGTKICKDYFPTDRPYVGW